MFFDCNLYNECIGRFKEKLFFEAPHYNVSVSSGFLTLSVKIREEDFSVVCHPSSNLTELISALEYLETLVRNTYVNIETTKCLIDGNVLSFVWGNRDTKKMTAFERFTSIYLPKYALYYYMAYDKRTLQTDLQVRMQGVIIKTTFEYSNWVDTYLNQMWVLADKVKDVFPDAILHKVNIGDGCIMPVMYEGLHCVK